jgi:hypothetical protein
MRLAIIFMLVMMPLSGMAAESIGRLFMTPAERANLDVVRQNSNPVNLKQEEALPETVIKEPDSISIQGYVKRSDGKKSTVWINNTPMQEDQGNTEVQVGKLGKSANQVQITLPASGRSVNLKPGQTYDSVTDSVREVDAKPLAADTGKKKSSTEDAGTIGLENLPDEIKKQLYRNSPNR